MKLDREALRVQVLESGNRSVGGAGDDAKPGRWLHDAIAVARPDLLLCRNVFEEDAGFGGDLCGAVLSLVGGFNLPIEKIGRHLHSVADRENGNPELEDLAR